MSRLPSLGRRGEGWFGLQILFFWAILTACLVAPGPDAGTGIPAWLGLALGAGGGAVVVWAMLALRGSLSPLPYPNDAGLMTDGPYAAVRHPIYVGVVAVAVGASFWRASVAALILSVALAMFFDLKARREEAWLRERYPGYDEYIRHTRRFLPGIY